jgi:hypothetical protein
MALLTFKVVCRLLMRSFRTCWLENIEFCAHFLLLVCFLVSLFTIHTLQLEIFVVFQILLLPFKVFCSFNHIVYFL